MKKSKQIQLLLISAALASCNREFVPAASSTQLLDKSVMTQEPTYDDRDINPNCVPCYLTQQLIWNYAFNPGNYYSFSPISLGYYSSGYKYRSAVISRGNKLIIRGGWGKTATTSTAS
jgi:hypothetical protein